MRKHRMILRMSALLLALVMVCGLVPVTAQASGAEGLTRGEVRDILLAAADDYNPAAEGADVLRGYGDGRLGEEDPATRVQAMVMLSRAFGELPEPVGDNARKAIYPEFTDVPQWAQAEIDALVAAGILTGTEEGVLAPDLPITREHLELMIKRVYGLFGSNLKDDFYAAVNKEWLDGSVLLPGYRGNGTVYELRLETNQAILDIILELAAGEHVKGSPEDKIKTLYRNILDWDARNAAGVEPLRPYLDAIDSAETLEELMEVSRALCRDSGESVLLGFDEDVDFDDSTRRLLFFYTMESDLYQSQYEDPAVVEALRELIATLMELSGSETPEADADALIELDRKLCEASLTEEQMNDIGQTYNVYTLEEIKELFPLADIEALLEVVGLPARGPVVVFDKGLMEEAASLFTEENLEVLKLKAKLDMLAMFGDKLSRPFLDAFQAYETAVFGTEPFSDEEVAAQEVQDLLQDDLGQIYVERHFSAQAKADVLKLVENIISAYSQRIRELEWMSDATKEKAIEKLGAITVNVGYPDEWSNMYEGVELRSAAEGGSYLENYFVLGRAYYDYKYADFLQPKDWSEWVIPVYMVNAGYMPQANSINFPAGILQPPLYDVNADPTENLGGIGQVIAHEITHAFDNNGAQFDANGNQKNWWTEEDYAAFRELCSGVIRFYDGLEIMPGIFCNGTLTLSENVADMGALACVTRIESMEAQPDYETLFRSFAKCWCHTSSREAAAFLSISDPHAPSPLRGSRVLQSVDEFYETFDIRPGDGMYLPPEERIRIW